MLKNRYTILLLLLTLFALSCNDDNGNSPEPIETASVYTTNEGNFADSNGMINSYDPQTEESIQKAFKNINDRPFAGIIQDSDVHGDRMYLASNNVDKIEVVNKKTLKSIDTIELSSGPVSVEVVDKKTAYVGTLDGTVSTVNLSNGNMTETLKDFNSPRDIVQVGGTIYVSNNGFGMSNTVIKIDADNFTKSDTLTVGAGPSEMIVDKDNRIWLVCNGKASFDGSTIDEPGSLYVIDGEKGSIQASITKGIAADGSAITKRLALDEKKATAYLINDGVSVIDMNTYKMTNQIINEGNFSAIGYFPIQERLYLADKRGKNGYGQTGKGFVYTLKGAAVDTFEAGIAPRDIYFVSE